MFGSALCYIGLRLLGEGPEDGEDRAMARGRRWILDHGGAVGIPSWGKFWLSVWSPQPLTLLYLNFLHSKQICIFTWDYVDVVR